MLHLLGDLLAANEQQRFYITIDRLDEGWIEDTLRFRLIRALIQTSLDFCTVKNAKIIVAIRDDLLDRVYRYTRDTGFQEEKYRTNSLSLTWSRDQLIDILDRRITLLVRDQYVGRIVTHKDILPQSRRKRQQAIDWMLDRTLMRPRDIISFFNACIQHADGKPVITRTALTQAEGTYSRERYRALADEWYGLYPNLPYLAQVLRNRDHLTLSQLSADDIQNNIIDLYVSKGAKSGVDSELVQAVWDNEMSIEEFVKELILIFYRVGLVGLKTEAYSAVSWSFHSGVSISRAELHGDVSIFVHKAFWRVLGIRDE